MKSVWSGSLSFGLVTIPIKLYSAVKEHVFGFTLLCKTCHQPIHYKRWCNHCKKEVAWNDVVKGIEVENNRYLILTQEKLKNLKPEKHDTIDITEFVDTKLIMPIYYDHHYYVAPANMHKAYSLFSHTLKNMHKAAIGQFIMREKEHVCAVQSYENGLLLSTLNYAYEIQPMKNITELAKKKEPFNTSEISLAKQLIAHLSKDDFDISNFKDTFVHALKNLLKKKTKGVKHIKKEKPKKITLPKKRLSLMTTLKESLKEARTH